MTAWKWNRPMMTWLHERFFLTSWFHLLKTADFHWYSRKSTGRIDGLTNWRTDRLSYRIARRHVVTLAIRHCVQMDWRKKSFYGLAAYGNVVVIFYMHGYHIPLCLTDPTKLKNTSWKGFWAIWERLGPSGRVLEPLEGPPSQVW